MSNNPKRSINNIKEDSSDKESKMKFKLNPLQLQNELEGVSNPLIKIIIHVEVFVINIFIYSIKLFTDLPKLLAYITPYDRYIISKRVLIYSVIYLALHQISIRFWYKSPLFIKPIFPVYTSYFLIILAAIGYFLCLKHKLSNQNESMEQENDSLYDDSDEDYIEDEDVESGVNEDYEYSPYRHEEVEEEENDWGISELPIENTVTSKITQNMQKRPKTHKKAKETSIEDIILPTKPSQSPVSKEDIPNKPMTSTTKQDAGNENNYNISQSSSNLHENDIFENDTFLKDDETEYEEIPSIDILSILKGNSIYKNDIPDDDDDDITIIN